MKKALPYFLFALLSVATCGCDSSDDSEYSSSYSDSEDDDSDDSGEANVQYSNPNTGTQSSYDLDVDYGSSGEVERINFNNGGWIDDSHITDQTNNGDGTITVETDTGAEYTVDEE